MKKSATTILSLFLLIFSSAALLSNPVHAGSSTNSSSGIGALVPDAKSQNKTSSPEYQQVTYANLYRLAWAMNIYKFSDTVALDNFLKISECKLYQNFYNNEFEWERIRKATREYFEKYDGKTSMYYEYVQPILLGRYDTSLQGFPVQESEKYAALKTLQLANYRNGDTSCGRVNLDRYKYPSSALLNIISPLSLTFIRVPKELAEEYIEWRGKEGVEKGYGRQAFIRFRVRVDSYGGMHPSSGGNEFIFNGRLMQIDVFADMDMLMPLYNQIF